MKNKNEIKVITAGQLIDGTGTPPVKDQMIVIQGSQILDVGPIRSIDLPRGEEVQELNFSGKTVLPGLIDCHVHITSPAD